MYIVQMESAKSKNYENAAIIELVSGLLYILFRSLTDGPMHLGYEIKDQRMQETVLRTKESDSSDCVGFCDCQREEASQSAPSLVERTEAQSESGHESTAV